MTKINSKSQQRLANPSGFPGLEIEFYHAGQTHCVSLERAKRLAEDFRLAVQEFETSNPSTRECFVHRRMNAAE